MLGLVRNPDHEPTSGRRREPAVLDLERTTSTRSAGCSTAPTRRSSAPGPGAGSGDDRKDTVDRAAATLLADACGVAAVDRYLLVSSMGVDSVRDGATPEGVDPAFVAYLRAKLAAEEDLVARQLTWTVLRPGRLTDDPGTGRVRAGAVRAARLACPATTSPPCWSALLDTPSTAGRCSSWSPAS